MKYAWDLPNSSLHEVNEDGSRGAEVGHCERLGNRHKEDGWVAFAKGFRILNGQWWIFPDESMAKQAVLDAVEGKTMSDEEKVRGAWSTSTLNGGLWLYESVRSYHLKLSGKEFKGAVKDKDAIWSAARAYTEQVLEEARQMREEIHLANEEGETMEEIIASTLWHGKDILTAVRVRNAVRKERLINRLESLYAEHVRGLKPEALK